MRNGRDSFRGRVLVLLTPSPQGDGLKGLPPTCILEARCHSLAIFASWHRELHELHTKFVTLGVTRVRRATMGIWNSRREYSLHCVFCIGMQNSVPFVCTELTGYLWACCFAERICLSAKPSLCTMHGSSRRTIPVQGLFHSIIGSRARTGKGHNITSLSARTAAAYFDVCAGIRRKNIFLYLRTEERNNDCDSG